MGAGDYEQIINYGWPYYYYYYYYYYYHHHHHDHHNDHDHHHHQLEFTPCKVEQPLQGMELQEKEGAC